VVVLAAPVPELSRRAVESRLIVESRFIVESRVIAESRVALESRMRFGRAVAALSAVVPVVAAGLARGRRAAAAPVVSVDMTSPFAVPP
jgi:hypothetical protein